MVRRIRQNAWRTLFEQGQRFGVNISRDHFYSNIPNIAQLKATTHWRKPRSMLGIAGADSQHQLATLKAWAGPHLEEIRKANPHLAAIAANGHGGYGSTDGDALYAFIRANNPRRTIQIGCGVSTHIIQSAQQASRSQPQPQLICVEPYPNRYLREQASARTIELLDKPAEKLPHDFYAQLDAGDLLFIDSTHALRPGGEVNELLCEILPALRPGVFVHLHDITFPYDYPPDLLRGRVVFWYETTLLYALLVHNPRLRIEASLAMLHHSHPRELEGLLPTFKAATLVDGLRVDGQGFCPGAIYLRTLEPATSGAAPART